MTPLGRRLFRFLTARMAPSSINIFPAGLLLSIHLARLESFLLGMKIVPIS